jgi:hypothetical protein
LAENPTLKGLQDAYVAAGVLPMPEEKEQNNDEKQKPSYTLSFKTKFTNVSDWDEASARDFLYEFERVARLAAQLKTEFSL